MSSYDEPPTIVLRKPQQVSRRHTVPKTNEEDIGHIEHTSREISHRITIARVAKGYKTRKDLAKALNINIDIINNIENKKGSYDKQKLNKICQFLGIKCC